MLLWYLFISTYEVQYTYEYFVYMVVKHCVQYIHVLYLYLIHRSIYILVNFTTHLFPKNSAFKATVLKRLEMQTSPYPACAMV